MKKVMIMAAIAVLALSSATMPKPAAVTYKLDAAKSTFKWTGKKVTGSHTGLIKFTDGQVSVDKGAIVGGSFNVDMNSMTCTDGAGDRLVGHLKSDDFFGVAKFPTATLVIKSATLKSGNDFDVKADLTIKGTTNEITFPATIAVSATEVTTKATFNVDRTKYGIKYGSGSFFDNLGDKAISNDFTVEVDLVAAAVAPAPAPVKTMIKKSNKKKAAASGK